MGVTLQDREAGLRAYTNHVTHELKSPLTSLIGAAELLEGEVSDEDRRHLTRAIRASAQTMQGQLDALRSLAAAREPVGRGPARLSEAIEGMEAGIAVRLEGDAELPMDAGALRVILTHLAQNAAAHGADRLTVEAERDGFTVRDNGSGIAEGNRKRVFDPFFTTRRDEGGTGMGLAIVRTMLQAVGGEITLMPATTGTALRVGFSGT